MNIYRLTPTCASHYDLLKGSEASYARLLRAHSLVSTWYHDDGLHPAFDSAPPGKHLFRGVHAPAEFLRTSAGIFSEVVMWKQFADLHQYADHRNDWALVMDADTYFGSGEVFHLLDVLSSDIVGTGDPKQHASHLSGGAVFIRMQKFVQIANRMFDHVLDRGAHFGIPGVPFARDAILGYYAEECRCTRTILPHDDWYTGSTYGHLEHLCALGGYMRGSLFFHVHAGERRDKGVSIIRELNRNGWKRE